MQGQFQNNPLMGVFNQMMSGKNTQQQLQTLLNTAKSRGIDIDAKTFSAEDLRTLGLIK